MPLRVCVLASGSSGNCVYVGSEQTQILIDAGLSCREIGNRLGSIGVALSDLQAVCLTHEHEDHRTSLGVLQRRMGMALYANGGTVEALTRNGKLQDAQWTVFTTGTAFEIGDLELEPFSVPHDSYDPVGFVLSCGDVRVGMVTDMGVVTGLIRQRLSGCRMAIIESNHDKQLLQDADRPWPLKQRIAGRQGHLSNEQAGALAAEIAGPTLQHVLLAHLSADCNRPELALKTVRRALDAEGHAHVNVALTYPDRISDIIEL